MHTFLIIIDYTEYYSDAWHHCSDALSSLAVLIGVGVAILGETFNVGFLVYGDATAGITVSIVILKVGFDLTKDSPEAVNFEDIMSKTIKIY